MQADILPILLGGDMNCYSVARAFHEAYGVKSVALGRYKMGDTLYSRIVKAHAVDGIDTEEGLLAALQSLAKQFPQKTRILMGCTDDYASLLIRLREKLAGDYIVPYIDSSLMEKLESKQSFYRMCERYDIPHPATVVVENAQEASRFDSLPFQYPVVVKPSSSILYWKYPFDGMKKVYLANSAAEGKQISREIFASGYPDSLIVQDFIPGEDTGMRVLTAYCDRNAKVQMMCLGHVLLEEHSPKAIGNHAAILTEYNGSLMRQIQKFLEAEKYTGYANFDIKFDPRDSSYRVFEINLRQGRSNYYVTGAGINIARLVVEDRIFKKTPAEPLFYRGESFWHSVPLSVVWKYTADAELIRRAKGLVKAGQVTSSFIYKADLRWNLARQLYLKEHNRRWSKLFDRYCKIPVRPASMP